MNLDPYHRGLRYRGGFKAVKRAVSVVNNPSRIEAGQTLQVQFPSLGENDLVVPGTSRLAFNIEVQSSDPNCTVVQNLGRAIVKKMVIRLGGKEIMSIADSDVLNCYTDLWKTPQERENGHAQGIDTSPDQNCTKLRVGAGNADAAVWADRAIADSYGSRYIIPLDFELLESSMPYYQSSLREVLMYELTLNPHSDVVIAAGDPNASYSIEGIHLEYDVITSPEVARLVRSQYTGRMSIMHDHVHELPTEFLDNGDSEWTIRANVTFRSIRGVLILFKDAVAGQPFTRGTESYYNPEIQKVEISVNGVVNRLYSQGMHPHHQWEEVRKHFAGGAKRQSAVAKAAKDLHLAGVSMGEYLTTKYGLWLDFRSTDDDSPHGAGMTLESGSHGIILQIRRKPGPAGKLNAYVFVYSDALLNIEDGRLQAPTR